MLDSFFLLAVESVSLFETKIRDRCKKSLGTVASFMNISPESTHIGTSKISLFFINQMIDISHYINKHLN